MLLTSAPDLVPRLLGHGDATITPLRLANADFVSLNHPEYRADAVFLVGDPPAHAYVLEAQLTINLRKLRTWPHYLTGLRVHHGLDCPIDLVVITLDPKVAAWARRPIYLSPRSVLHAIVLGPADIPVIADHAAAKRHPELAVLSALAHAHDAHAEATAMAAVAACSTLDSDRAALYTDAIFARLAPAILEKLMLIPNYEYQSDFARKYYAEGKMHGKASMLLQLFALKNLPLTLRQREALLATVDDARLTRWAERLLSASSLAEIFTPDAPLDLPDA